MKAHQVHVERLEDEKREWWAPNRIHQTILLAGQQGAGRMNEDYATNLTSFMVEGLAEEELAISTPTHDVQSSSSRDNSTGALQLE